MKKKKEIIETLYHSNGSKYYWNLQICKKIKEIVNKKNFSFLLLLKNSCLKNNEIKNKVVNSIKMHILGGGKAKISRKKQSNVRTK